MVKLKLLPLIFIIVFSIRSETGEPDHRVPLFLSFIFPGGGQIYNGRYIKAVAYAALEGVLIYGAWKQDQRLNDAKDELSYYTGINDPYKIREYEFYVDRYTNERNNFIWMSAAAVLLSAGDAFVDSHFKSFKRDVFKSGDELSIKPAGAGIKLVYQW